MSEEERNAAAKLNRITQQRQRISAQNNTVATCVTLGNSFVAF